MDWTHTRFGARGLAGALRCAMIAAALTLPWLTDNAWAWAADAKKPNVLFLLTDDQRADTIGAMGNPAIKTPAMDSLVRRGFAFRNAYVLGGNVPAVCTPSRNMIMSGRAYFRWQGLYAPPDRPNFPVTLGNAGYVTYHHGKKGNTAVLIQEKFDTNKYLKDDVDREAGEPGKTIVDDAIAFLKDKHDDRPFFMYLAFANPHDPRVAAQKYLDMYPPDKIPLPKNFMPVHPFDNGEMVIRDELLAPWPRTPDEIRMQLREYYAVITGLDYHIGRLLDALKALKLDENTIIVFASDNGLSLGSHGLMGKQNLYEEGTRIPLIFAGPGIIPGRSDALVYLMDIFPTVCDLVSIPVPTGLDGKSLKPIIARQGADVRPTLFTSYRDAQRAIRDDRWKLIRYPKINKTQLFDLKDDPDEVHDLAGDPTQAERIERMMAALARWQKQIGDTAPLISEHPKDPTFTPPTGEALEKLLKPAKKK
jgi:arylsulfatase A-like enzyme